jgi:predicted Zn-dependent protease
MHWHSFFRRPPGLAALATAFSLLGGCATTVITPEVEEAIGTEMSVTVANQIGLYRQQPLEAWVAAVGERLVAELGPTPYTFRFAVVDQFEPNAFATPGGFVYVSRGLLAQMNTEDELAGVLAHEISHITQRHHARQAGRSLGAGLMTIPGRAVGIVSRDLGNMINAPIEAAGQVYLASFSRAQETEADAVGLKLSASAGYDPMALASALTGIERTVLALTGKKHQATFFDTHPTTPTRVSDIERQIKGIAAAGPVAPLESPAGVQRRLDGLWVGRQNPQQGVFDGQVFRSASLDMTMTFPRGWKTVNTPRYVAAVEPEGGAYLAVASRDNAMAPTELADSYAARMREEAALEPSESRAFQIGDWPAHVLRYDDTSGGETVSLFYLFTRAPQETFQIVSIAREQHRDALRETVFSLRPLTDADREKVAGLRLRLATPAAGESLESFNVRVGNRWPPDLTRAINGLPENSGAPPGAVIKVGRVERYSP